jgi:hypothetical protein
MSARTTEGALLEEQYRDLERYFDQRIAEAEASRAACWKRDYISIERYLASVAPHRRRFVDLLGGFPAAKTPLQPRRGVLGETESYRTERVWLQAVPGIEVYGVLLVPRQPWKEAGADLPARHGRLTRSRRSQRAPSRPRPSQNGHSHNRGAETPGAPAKLLQ